MKTQIIQLEAHDDVISTRDKMGWSQTSRILLVWPGRDRILTRRLDLVLLQRHSSKLGTQLAFVTHDPDVRYFARQLGIPIYGSPREAQAARWRSIRWRRPRSPRKPVEGVSLRPEFEALHQQIHPSPPAWLERPGIRLGFLSLSLLAILAVAVVILPGAQITLTPQTSIQEVTLPVSAGTGVKVLNLAGELPVQIRTIVVEGRESLPTSGIVQVPETPAVGGIQFTNLTDKEVVIPTNTVVSTLGREAIRFATIQAGKVAAGPGKNVILPARAALPGAAGNLPANSLQAIEGPLGLQLSATNLASTHDGADHTAQGPSSQDRTRLYNQLLAKLQKTAQEELADQSTGKHTVEDYPITPTLKLSQVLEKEYLPFSDAPADQISLTLRLEFQAQAISGADLEKLVTPILDASLPQGATPVPDSLVILHGGDFKIDEENVVRWTVQAQRQIRKTIVAGQVADLVRGQPVKGALSRLEASWALEGPPQIHLRPAWWPWLPFLPFRISVAIQENSG